MYTAFGKAWGLSVQRSIKHSKCTYIYITISHFQCFTAWDLLQPTLRTVHHVLCIVHGKYRVSVSAV